MVLFDGREGDGPESITALKCYTERERFNREETELT